MNIKNGSWSVTKTISMNVAKIAACASIFALASCGGGSNDPQALQDCIDQANAAQQACVAGQSNAQVAACTAVDISQIALCHSSYGS